MSETLNRFPCFCVVAKGSSRSVFVCALPTRANKQNKSLEGDDRACSFLGVGGVWWGLVSGAGERHTTTTRGGGEGGNDRASAGIGGGMRVSTHWVQTRGRGGRVRRAKRERCVVVSVVLVAVKPLSFLPGTGGACGSAQRRETRKGSKKCRAPEMPLARDGCVCGRARACVCALEAC